MALLNNFFKLIATKPEFNFKLKFISIFNFYITSFPVGFGSFYNIFFNFSIFFKALCMKQIIK